RLSFFSLLSLVMASSALAHEPAKGMADAATKFLSALTPDQHAKATFEMNNTERSNWKFVPAARKGLPIKEMTSAQRELAHSLLREGLSQRGYLKATTIMSLEQVLHDIETSGPVRDPELYFFTLFGKPGEEVWGWRVEGHHLSVNFT